MEEQPIVEGYCVRCRTKTRIKDPKQLTMKNGRPAIQGACPACGTKIFKIGRISKDSVGQWFKIYFRIADNRPFIPLDPDDEMVKFEKGDIVDGTASEEQIHQIMISKALARSDTERFSNGDQVMVHDLKTKRIFCYVIATQSEWTIHVV